MKPKFSTTFQSFVCFGDAIRASAGNVTFTARLEQDCDSSPDDYDCYSDEDKALFACGDAFFVGIVVSATIGDVEFPHLSSVWACEANLTDDNSHLDDTARDLLDEAIPELRKRLASLTDAAAQLEA